MRAFSFRELFGGALIYEFEVFYRVKNHLIRYDDRSDYVNYGFWDEGSGTENPSAALVQRVADAAGLRPGDRVLDIGSGMGQPDIDIVRSHEVAQITGINICDEQIDYTRQRVEELGLSDRIEYRKVDIDDMATELATEQFDAALCIEAIAEAPSIERLATGAHGSLRPGGRFACCGEVRLIGEQPGLCRRIQGRCLSKLTQVLYEDNYRALDEYLAAFVAAGFEDVTCERIGDRVYKPTWDHAKSRWSSLRQDRSIPGVLKLFGYFNLRGLALMHEWKELDYVIISGTKPK